MRPQSSFGTTLLLIATATPCVLPDNSNNNKSSSEVGAGSKNRI